MEEKSPKPKPPKGIRWPDEIENAIKRTADIDGRDFTHQVLKLIEWGLEEREAREIEARLRKTNRSTLLATGSEATPRTGTE